MSAVDEIIGYKRSPNEEFYALLNCDEHSSVSVDATNPFFAFILLDLCVCAVCGVCICARFGCYGQMGCAQRETKRE